MSENRNSQTFEIGDTVSIFFAIDNLGNEYRYPATVIAVTETKLYIKPIDKLSFTPFDGVGIGLCRRLDYDHPIEPDSARALGLHDVRVASPQPLALRLLAALLGVAESSRCAEQARRRYCLAELKGAGLVCQPLDTNDDLGYL